MRQFLVLAVILTASKAVAESWSKFDAVGLESEYASHRNLEDPGIALTLEEECEIIIEQDLRDGVECSCDILESGIVEYSCFDTCSFCSDDDSSCGKTSFILLLTDVLEREFETADRSFEYDGRGGRFESLKLEQRECEDFVCSECDAFINGTLCDSCELDDDALVINCENFAPGSSFDERVQPTPPGPWESLSYDRSCDGNTFAPSEINTFDGTGTFVPTDLGTEFPSFPFFEPPPNDSCDDAIIVSIPSTIVGSINGSTFDEEVPDCENSFPGSNGAWYKFFGNGKPLIISSCGDDDNQNFDILSVYAGLFLSCGNLQCLEQVIEDRECGGNFNGGSTLFFDTDLGKTYYLYVSERFFSPSDFRISFTFIDEDEGSSCVAPKEIEIDGPPITEALTSSSFEDVLDLCDQFFPPNGVAWFSFEAQEDAMVRASTCSINTIGVETAISILEVTEGCEEGFCVAQSEPFRFVNGCGAGGSDLEFEVSAGQTYRLAVLGLFADIFPFEIGIEDRIGSFELTLETIEPPSNDVCEGAIPLPNDGATIGSLADATISADELDSFCLDFFSVTGGLWYSFEGTGEAAILDACSDDTSVLVSVYSGDCGALVCESETKSSDARCDGQFGDVNSFITEAGVTYYVLVSANGRGIGDFTLSLSFFEPAENSSCSGAIRLAPDGSTIEGTTISSVLGEEEEICFSSTSESAWYVVVGTGKTLRADTNADDFDLDTEITVYRGICEDLRCIGANDDGGFGLASLITWQSDLFANYYIRVSGLRPGQQGDFSLTVSSFEAAENDECVGATPLTFGESVVDSFEFASLTTEPLCDSNFASEDPSLWYSFVGTGNVVDVTTCNPNSSLPTELRVLSGSCGELLCEVDIFETDGSCDSIGVSAKFLTELDVIYYVVVTSFEIPEFSSAFEISVSDFEPLPNDFCNTAEFIDDIFAGPIAGTNVDAIVETSGCNQLGADGPGVWYTFIGTGDVVLIDTCSEVLSFPPALTISTGDCETPQCLVAASAFSTGAPCDLSPTSELSVSAAFPTIAGQQYYVLVEGIFEGLEGDFELSFEVADVVENNLCSGAFKIESGDIVLGNTSDATVSGAFECSFSEFGSKDLWYEIDGTGELLDAVLCSPETDFDTRLSIYLKEDDGTCDQSCVTENDDFCGLASKVSWFAEFGSTYLIRVHGFGDDSGTFELTVGPDIEVEFDDDQFNDDAVIGEEDDLEDMGNNNNNNAGNEVEEIEVEIIEDEGMNRG